MAEQRYHLNPKTGNPNICRANPDNCPYGPVPHYGSKEEARAGYEASQQDELFAGPARLDVRLNKHGFLEKDLEDFAAPKGVYCPHCGIATSAQEAAILIGNEFVSCHGCESRYDLVEARIDLTPENPSSKFLQDEEVLNATWYHATSHEYWLEEIDGDPNDLEVHVGTEAAAFDRAITEYASHGRWGHSFYLYELKLAPDSRLKGGVDGDENGKLLEDEDTDVVRYLNRWEDMASISLAVRPGKVIVGDRREVSLDEAHRRLTPYNITPQDFEEEKVSPLTQYLDDERLRRLAELEKEELESIDRAGDIFERAMERIISASAKER